MLLGQARCRRAKHWIPGWVLPDEEGPGLAEPHETRGLLLQELRLPDALARRAGLPEAGAEPEAEREAAGLWPQLHLFSAGLP